MRSGSIWLALASLSLPLHAVAASAPDPVTGFAPPALIDELTAQAVELARGFAGQARLSDGSNLPVATPEDRRRFAIPATLERQTVRRGMLTGQLQYCGGDGMALSFRPYMGQLRASRRYSDHQLAYVGVLHGVSQQMIMGAMGHKPTEVCTDAFRATLSAAASSEAISTP